MSAIRSNKVTGPAVVAISQGQDRLRGAIVGKGSRGWRVLWTKRSEQGELDWGVFASECGLSKVSADPGKTNSNRIVAAGFDSSGVVFNRISVPSVNKEHLADLVRLQAESRFPLPSDRMNYAWRPDVSSNGSVPVTIAAARKQQLERFVSKVRDFGPRSILLDCEGIVRVWRDFFGGSDETSLIMSVGQGDTKVCLSQNGCLVNAVSLDMGLKDIDGSQGSTVEATERYCRDTASVLGLFGYSNTKEVPVYVLSDDSEAMKNLVTSLELSGLDARRSLVDSSVLSGDDVSIDDVYEYRVAIGIGLAVLQGRADTLDIFAGIYNPDGDKKKKRKLFSLKAAIALSAVMALLLVGVFLASDIWSLKIASNYLTGKGVETNFNQIMKRRGMMKAAAGRRPDLLALLKTINSCEAGGISLDGYSFKRGNKIEITGQADNADQVFKFQESMLSQKNISDVEIKSTSKAKEGGKLRFAITFHYMKFTK